jgi:23S rRNA (guanine745-N1)-methyltransferase
MAPEQERSAHLACTVRGCGAPLARAGACWRCPSGHSFDVSRRGYVNLLQPQDRRSLAAGDSAVAVDARARSLERGVGRALQSELVAVVYALGLPPGAIAVELGSGTGDLLRELAATAGFGCIGLDLSVPAIEHAARVERETLAAGATGAPCTWVVANADRRLPLLDGSAALVLSVQGRRNPSEALRVLAPGGSWLIAVPGVDDLAELRAAAIGALDDDSEMGTRQHGVASGADVQPSSRSRLDVLLWELVEQHLPFQVARRGSSCTRQVLDAVALADLCSGTYTGLRRREAERVAALQSLAITLHSDWALLRRP